MRLSKGDIGRILQDFCFGLGTKCDLDAPSHKKAYDKAVERLGGKASPETVRYAGGDLKVRPRRALDGNYLESDRDYVGNNMELCVRLLDTLDMADLLNSALKGRR